MVICYMQCLSAYGPRLYIYVYSHVSPGWKRKRIKVTYALEPPASVRGPSMVCRMVALESTCYSYPSVYLGARYLMSSKPHFLDCKIDILTPSSMGLFEIEVRPSMHTRRVTCSRHSRHDIVC